MPDKKTSAEGEVVKRASPPSSGVMSEAMQAGMMQIFGEQEPYKPTKSQIDKILSLQEKGMDYTHKERTMWQPKQVMSLIVFVIVIIAILGLVALTAWLAKEYIGQVITGAIAFVAGGAGGYGFANRKQRSEDE